MAEWGLTWTDWEPESNSKLQQGDDCCPSQSGRPLPFPSLTIKSKDASSGAWMRAQNILFSPNLKLKKTVNKSRIEDTHTLRYSCYYLQTNSINTMRYSVQYYGQMSRPSYFIGHGGSDMEPSMYDRDGNRKYMNARECRRFLRAAKATASGPVFTFCLVLARTGGRISEVLALTPRHIDVESRIILLRTLKQRKKKKNVAYRPIPVPVGVIRALDAVHQIKAARKHSIRIDEPIWPWCRTTAWTRVKEVMAAADISGIHACPKGLRHGYAVDAFVSGVGEFTVMRLLGHTRIETTLVYTEVVGAEARAIANRMWGWLVRLGMQW